MFEFVYCYRLLWAFAMATKCLWCRHVREKVIFCSWRNSWRKFWIVDMKLHFWPCNHWAIWIWKIIPKFKWLFRLMQRHGVSGCLSENIISNDTNALWNISICFAQWLKPKCLKCTVNRCFQHCTILFACRNSWIKSFLRMRMCSGS